MNPQDYPGRGLSLSQLAFALNKALELEAYSQPYVSMENRCPRIDMLTFFRSFTFNQVSQLDQDVSTALGSIREWRNSFVPINQLPSDVLSLIPTYLSAHDDRLRASFVCRYWRGNFLRRGELWSELFLSNGEDYVNTYLQRAKGCALDVFVHHEDPIATSKPLSSLTGQIRSLELVLGEWRTLWNFEDIVSGPLPLLQTLVITNTVENALNPNLRSPPLFSNAVNLSTFCFNSMLGKTPDLSHFIFPNLVSFDFCIEPEFFFSPSMLLDFLQASPMLQTVFMRFVTDTQMVVPNERVVVLPNVTTFTLVWGHGEFSTRFGYNIAARLSCPSVKSMSFVHTGDPDYCAPPGDIFPGSLANWGSIISNYTRHPVEEVTLKIKPTFPLTCQVTFWSSDGAAIDLHFRFPEFNDEDGLPPQEMYRQVLTNAILAIREHPERKNIKRLNICHSFRSLCPIPGWQNEATELWKLLDFLHSLEELKIYHCDIIPYICHPNDCSKLIEDPALSAEELSQPELPTEEFLLPTEVLEILHPTDLTEKVCSAIEELAKSHHKQEKRFKRVTIRAKDIPAGMEERLKPWVGSVECFREPYWLVRPAIT